MAAATAATLLGAGLAACGGSPGGGAPGTATAPPTRSEAPRTAPLGTDASTTAFTGPGPFEPGGLARAVSVLRRQMGAEPRFLAIFASPDSAVFVVQNPRVRRFVDTYDWQAGEMRGPRSPAERDPREFEDGLFTARQVRLAAVPRLVARADALPFEGSRAVSVSIQSGKPFTDGVEMIVHVSGLRRTGQVRADAQGRVTEVS